jgi:hypothetical protein
LAAMVVGETGYYWAHRLSHEIPFLWRFHAIHHSAEEIDYMVSSRAHPVDFVWLRLWMLTPLFALGSVNPMRFSDGAIPALILVVGSLWGFFVHANVRWRQLCLDLPLARPHLRFALSAEILAGPIRHPRADGRHDRRPTGPAAARAALSVAVRARGRGQQFLTSVGTAPMYFAIVF